MPKLKALGLGLRRTNLTLILLTAILVLTYISNSLHGSIPLPLPLEDEEIEGDGFGAYPDGAIEASRRPPAPPTWERLRKWEDELPQHNLDLPFPEGREGRYVKFDNQVRQLGWNNVLNEVLMNAHLAYISNRSYVFLDYYWKPEYYSWPRHQHLSSPPRTPLNALISGPASGLPWEANDPAPRSISEKWFDTVCPPSVRKHINTRDVKPAVWHAPGIEVLHHWAKVLRDEKAKCVQVDGATWEEDMFSQIFDLWIWGSDRVLSLWDEFIKSPVSRLLETSPVVRSAVEGNEYLFMPASGRGGVGKKGRGGPRDPYERMMALHIRRGDFKEACFRLAYYNSTFYSWNLLPQLPDSFSVPPHVVWNTSKYHEVYIERCFPEQEAIREKIREVREAYVRAGRGSERVLDTLYLLTNAKGAWLRSLLAALKADGWHTIVTSKDLVLNAEQTDVNMAVDMEIARKAAVFVGNGWSSFTSNIVHRRLVDGKEPISTRFW